MHICVASWNVTKGSGLQPKRYHLFPKPGTDTRVLEGPSEQGWPFLARAVSTAWPKLGQEVKQVFKDLVEGIHAFQSAKISRERERDAEA